MKALISLDTLLALVGKLDDAATEDPPRERFRAYLDKNVTSIGEMRDYIEECLRGPGLLDITDPIG